MIKGILLGVSTSVFIVSVIFILAGATGNLQENIITGAAVGSGAVIGWSFVGVVFGLIGILGTGLWIREKSIN